MVVGLVCYALTTTLAALAAWFGPERPALVGRGYPGADSEPRLDRLFQADARWYERIARDGYFYDPRARSSVAFFPVYPLLGRAVATLTGLPIKVSLLLTAHVALAGCFVLVVVYARTRYPDAPPAFDWLVGLSFGLFPATLFFRMAYSESTFLLLVLLAGLGMRRRWPAVVGAVIIGLATAARPVGVTLVLPFLLNLWSDRRSVGGFVCQALLLLPLCSGGLLAYIAFQFLAFDEPLAFARTQTHWSLTPRAGLVDRLAALIAFEPVWGYLDPDAPCYWSHLPGEPDPLSGPVMDRLTFLAAVGLIAVGWRRRWLTADELLLAIGLIGVAYLTRGYEMCFASMGRFSTVAFPIYLVLGRLLVQAPRPVAAVVLTISGCLLACYAARFAAGYFLI